LGAAIGLAGGLGANGYRAVTSLATPTNAVYTDNLSGGQDNWFYVDEILGSGGSSGPGAVANGGAGGGGGYGGFGGILGGGGRFAPGGLAGGGGDGNNGGAGLVILYW
jgi:hypothetical protein